MFLQELRLVHPAYANTKAEGLANIRNRSGVLSVFDAPTYKIFFAMCRDTNPRRDLKESRIWIAIPSGKFTRNDLTPIAKALIRRARAYCQVYGVRYFKAKTLDDYQDPLLNDLYQKVIPSLMHEVEETDDPEKVAGTGAFRMRFDRRPEKIAEDEDFVGRDKFRNRFRARERGDR